MLSKKQVIASVLLCAMIGMSAGCQGEQGPLLDPKTGEPLTERVLGSLESFYGLSEPTQKDVNEYYLKKSRAFGGAGEVHPKDLAAQGD